MKSVSIDIDRCNGCGLCVKACHEGVIALRDGKAIVANMSLCDGIGDCLPACPMNAITFMDVDRPVGMMAQNHQWPIKMALVSPSMECFSKGVLNIAADCTAFTVAEFKGRFSRDAALIIGCPKLDPIDRFEKIDAIIANNNIRVINVLRMQIPCCNMLSRIVNERVKMSGKDIKVNETVFATNGSVAL